MSLRLMCRSTGTMGKVAHATWKGKSPALPLCLFQVMHLRRHVKRRFAAADALVALAGGGHLLGDVQVERDVELGLAGHQGCDVLAGFDLVDRRTEAGAEERVLQVLAHHRVVPAAD